MTSTSRPVIGLTADAADDKYLLSRGYCHGIADAGGVPIILPCRTDLLDSFLELCDGFILTGGDDPSMERWGIPTHSKAKPIDPERQEFELELLARLDDVPHIPALGICLGMQLMGLHAGGKLDQHLPDSLPTASKHWGRTPHTISGELGTGTVLSHHRQALTSTGSLHVAATAEDGVIEAIKSPNRPFYLGVQWHPERTDDKQLGIGILKRLVDAARTAATR
ncbi:MAG TPA: gamma-glutamyl-gamma-aminobutyrate hydrolase family protein [Phycisphaerales bacterium]|nr:gamma-glutamyl-gamma-aminobutyrate hydrolase family protein [Phycisphaerales bacterium]HRQ74393.1 gamma-glutamyl-gamma-aminobutyrate hydrolase family protein [Phycisphaerales bacterium]